MKPAGTFAICFNGKTDEASPAGADSVRGVIISLRLFGFEETFKKRKTDINLLRPSHWGEDEC